MNSPQPPVLIFAPSPFGGLAEHVHYQANELVRRGFAVIVLCRPDFVKSQAGSAYRQDRRLLARPGASLADRLVRAALTIANWYILAWRIVALRPAFVLLEANSEFHAAAWFLPHWLLRLAGVVMLANFHDPVRGPEPGQGREFERLSHAVSIRLAYAALSGGLIHGPPPPRAFLPARLVIREAPFGPFTDLLDQPPAFDLRERLGIPREAFVVLAFGHIADRKNLDRLIAALPEVPQTQLVVAGRATSANDKDVDYYAGCAQSAGVAERVHFVTDYIAETDIAAYFAAADAIALTYARGFVSQSGVLQIAALWDRPLLASGGPGPLRDTVEEFGLGLTIEPDSVPAITTGLRHLIDHPEDRSANFARYRATTSWAVNIDRLLEVAGVVGTSLASGR
jgi:glycosyltransferase involved in cell wall biosynthesis